MSEKETGGPAFPECSYNMRGGYDITGGMTLRDYFAAKVLRLYSDDTLELMEENARKAYAQADAMLKARNQ